MGLTSNVWSSIPPQKLPKDVIKLTKLADKRLSSYKVSTNHRKTRLGKGSLIKSMAEKARHIDVLTRFKDLSTPKPKGNGYIFRDKLGNIIT